MYTVKETSTNQSNKVELVACPVSYTLNKIGGRWKPMIIYNLRNGPLRYSVLKRNIPNVTEKMLIQNLRELEMDNLVSREVKAVVPPHVTYRLTSPGRALRPIMESMAQWGNTYSKREARKI